MDEVAILIHPLRHICDNRMSARDVPRLRRRQTIQVFGCQNNEESPSFRRGWDGFRVDTRVVRPVAPVVPIPRNGRLLSAIVSRTG
jgi:hypothetical protein